MNKNYFYMLSLTVVCAVLFAFFSCDGTYDNEGGLGIQGKLITDVPLPNGVKM